MGSRVWEIGPIGPEVGGSNQLVMSVSDDSL
jgi:hypothetical protein